MTVRPTTHGHGHGHGHGHDHSFEFAPVPDAAESMEGIEQITLHSAGLDIGSATSHLTISRLVLRRRGAELSTQLVVAERTELYRSLVLLTPYRTDTLIDADVLEAFRDRSYAEAGVKAADIDTGVVIVTGEAANRPNAEELAARFAARAGTFICVSAGPHYEALLAAHGSGATAISRAKGCTVLNIDIGGGTTKLSLVEDGRVAHTGAVSVGARLVAFDPESRLVRVEPPGRWMLEQLGASAELGEVLPAGTRGELAALMVDLLFQVVTTRQRTPLLDRLWVTEPLPADVFSGVDTIVFSGGVSEYVYRREQRDFGDLGPALGDLVRDRLEAEGLAARTQEPAQGIRATVLGAGQHSIQASGVTSFIDDDLPATGLKVVSGAVRGPGGLAGPLTATAERFRLDDGSMPDLVYALTIGVPVDYRLLRALAEELLAVARLGTPLHVVLDVDVAHALGRILRDELGWHDPLVVLDGVTAGELDYLDIGRPLGPGLTVPVTVKSLTFLTR